MTSPVVGIDDVRLLARVVDEELVAAARAPGASRAAASPATRCSARRRPCSGSRSGCCSRYSRCSSCSVTPGLRSSTCRCAGSGSGARPCRLPPRWPYSRSSSASSLSVWICAQSSPTPFARDTAPDTEPRLTPTLRATSRCDRFSSSFCRKISRRCRIGSLFVAISPPRGADGSRTSPTSLRSGPRLAARTLVTLSRNGRSRTRKPAITMRRNGRSR